MGSILSVWLKIHHPPKNGWDMMRCGMLWMAPLLHWVPIGSVPRWLEALSAAGNVDVLNGRLAVAVRDSFWMFLGQLHNYTTFILFRYTDIPVNRNTVTITECTLSLIYRHTPTCARRCTYLLLHDRGFPFAFDGLPQQEAGLFSPAAAVSQQWRGSRNVLKPKI